MTCDDVRAEAAVGLLSGTPLDEQVRDHLTACAPCREEVEALADVVGLLPLAGIDGGEAADRPDELGLRRLLAAAAGNARRRHRRARLLVAVAAVVAAIAMATGIVLATSDPPASSTLTMSASDPVTGVTGHVRVTSAGPGSQLDVRVSGVAEGTTCRLVVVDADGRRTPLSTWTAEYDGTATVTTASTLPVDQVSALQLVDTGTGRPLLTLTP